MQGLEKKFTPRRKEAVLALADVDLEVADGEFLLLLGPSGCGKTTLLRILAGQESPTSGRVLMDGEDITTLPPEARPLNMVFQSPALFPHMSVYENVAFGPRLAKLPKAEVQNRVMEALALVRLKDLAERAVTQISGGQAQRIALARALVNRPRVLLLDEPLSALDLQLRKEMQSELTLIHERLGTTFVFVTHDQSEALTLADRIAVMEGGRILQVGAPLQIYTRPATRFVSTFIGDSNLFEVTVVASGDDCVEVRGPGLSTKAPRPVAVTVGDAAWLSVRPEKILLTPGEAYPPLDGPLDCVVHHGEVRSAAFLGASVRYVVGLRDGPEVAVSMPFEGESQLLQRGAAVRLCWAVEDCLVLGA